MENTYSDFSATDLLLAQRLKSLRAERGWSLDELAKRSTVSRATLSRLENAEVSPTASVLGKLCAAYGLTMSRLMFMVEEKFVPVMCRSEQPLWVDPVIGFRRRSVSPPTHALAAEVLECELDPDTHITYDRPPELGLEHYLLLIEGQLHVRIEGQSYDLQPGDCLRYQLSGSSTFGTSQQSGARYILFIL